MGRKKYVAILDTETTFPEQHVFDIALLIGDLHGNIIFERQWIIKEKISQKMFYEEKRGLYLKRLKNQNYPVYFMSLEKIFSQMKRIFEHYNIKEIYAYNMSFDSRVIDNIAKEYELPNPLKNLDLECLWFWSVQSVFQQKSFPKFCQKFPYHHMTLKGNYKTSAETCYAYINRKPLFEEEHTALEDCRIEYAIFLHCRKQKKFRCKGIASNVWLLVQNDEQIEKLPPQFRTMKVNLHNQIEKTEQLAKRFKKKVAIEVGL